jgi:rod shape-determining protein MreD
MIPPSTFLALPIMALLTILQTATLPRFPILGIVPSLPFLVALAWGLLRGVNEGVIWAFIGGFFLDLFTAAPAGGLALTYMISIFAVLQINEVLPANRFVIPMILAAVATVIQWLLYAIFLGLFGYNVLPTLPNALVSLVILHTFLILPIYWLFYLVQRTVRPNVVEI